MGTFQFKESSYYDYKINSQKTDSVYVEVLNGNLPENLLTKRHSDFLVKMPNQENELVLFSRMTINYNLSEYYFIKYALRKNKEIIKRDIVVFSKNEDNWSLSTESNYIIEKISTILKLNNEAFSQFEIMENNGKYLEINKLKSLVKDDDGVLNLSKLADVIEKDKILFSKYLDE